MMNNELKMQNEKSIPKGFKLTEMGVIPEDWCCIQAKELINFLGGFAFSSKSAKDSGVRWLKIANVGLNEIKWDTEAFLPQSYLSTYQDYELKHGDVVMALTRPILSGRLKIAQLKKSDVPSLLNQRVAKLTPKIEGCLPFIYHLVQSSDFIAAMNLAMAGSDPPNIGAHSLGEILIRAPFAVKEQAAIADILSDTDILITEIEQLIAKKKDIKTATMQQLLSGRTRLPPFAKHPNGTFKGYRQNELGVFPEDWGIVSVADVLSEISMGPFGSDIKVSNFTKTGIPVLSGSNVSSSKLIDSFKNFVTEEKAKELKKAVANRGDVIVTHRGTIGQISYIPDNSKFEKYVISQSQFRARFKKEINPAWVVLYFLSPKGSSSLLDGKGHTGVPAIAQATTTFRKLQFPCPSNEEQTAITNILSDMDAELATLGKKLAKLRDIKQGMMQQLLTGRIRLPLDQQP